MMSMTYRTQSSAAANPYMSITSLALAITAFFQYVRAIRSTSRKLQLSRSLKQRPASNHAQDQGHDARPPGEEARQ
jgi:ABC-type nickel/cobalt efflux system permease component RcnA